MRKIITICIIGLFALNVQAQPVKTLKLSDKELLDKIKGGWYGQTIGVVFGAPTEFKFTGTYIQDYQPIPWAEGYVKYWWEKKPGLFDDIYNDCTFVEAFDELGTWIVHKKNLPKDLHSLIIIYHANQAGRYNIRQGIMPPASGHWLNNPHADDLDFQIEADFIGLMAPAMLPEALDIASRVCTL
ncbi:ADP-ribosylglycohydrolase family protein [Bacteroides ovatus]|nr:ADP-ribosylglycohydrolase family protein [Bacteroides ovatus]